ncbi:hypothetical protein [Vibrio sp. TBV020]|uniref:hypothetical protein n=1 Tax=Vibrio sp. TBV020 TaxID=3137398 RepID=UPI0038CD241A
MSIDNNTSIIQSDQSSTRVSTPHSIEEPSSSPLRQRTGEPATQSPTQSLEKIGANSHLSLTLSALNKEKPQQKQIITKHIRVIYNALHDKIKKEADHKFQCAQTENTSSKSKLNAQAKTLYAQLDTLIKDIYPLLNHANLNEKETLSLDDTARLYNALQKLAKQSPKGNMQVLIGLLSQHIKSDWMQMECVRLQEGQLKKYEKFGEPGTGKSTAFNVDMNVAGSLLSTVNSHLGPYLSGTVGVKNNSTIDADDEGLYFSSKTHARKLKLKGGIQVGLDNVASAHFSVTANGQSSKTKFKEYDNAESYVKQEGHRLVTQRNNTESQYSFTKRIKTKISGKTDSNLKRLPQELQRSTDNQHRLNHLLKSELNIDAKIFAPPPAKAQPLYGFFNTTSASIDFDGGININTPFINLLQGTGANFSITKSTTNIYEFVPTQFLDAVKENNKRITELPSKFTKHAQHILDKINTPRVAIGALKQLQTDLECYINTVQNYDSFKASPNHDKAELNRLHGKKQTIEDRWNAVGRHQFLQFAAASHALFTSTLMPDGELADDISIEEESKINELIDKTSDLLRNPSIQHNKKWLNDIATFQKEIYLKNSDTLFSSNISFSGFNGQISVLVRDRIHPSRVREGSYIDVTISGSAIGSLQQTIPSATIKNLAEKCGATFPADIDIPLDIEAGPSRSYTFRFFKPKYSQDEHYSGERGYRKQFLRITKNFSAGLNGGISGMLSPGIHSGITLGANKSKTTLIGEEIGTNDLTYTTVRFNRFYRSADKNVNNENWNNFFDKNKSGYQKMFDNLGTAGCSLGMKQEILTFFQELKDRAVTETEKLKITSQKEAFFNAMNSFHVEKSDANFNSARLCLERYLEQLVEPWWEKHTSRWKDVSFKPKEDSGLHLSTKLIKNLGVHSRANKP